MKAYIIWKDGKIGSIDIQDCHGAPPYKVDYSHEHKSVFCEKDTDKLEFPARTTFIYNHCVQENDYIIPVYFQLR